MREVDQAVQYFKQLSEIDPYRLDNLDTYSNLLYVKEQRVELAYLAHKTAQIDKYRTETCCVIGNYYSLRSLHEKAVLYFQRALKLNPSYLSAWTLMGHEFIELKNTNAAIQSYRHAIGNLLHACMISATSATRPTLTLCFQQFQRSARETTGHGTGWAKRTKCSKCPSTASTTTRRRRS